MNEDRYSRQTLLKEIGVEGQRRLGEAKAVVVGCGALGTHASSLLVRAGVGETMVIDPDDVDISNLHRQTLFDERSVGRPKAEVAEELLTGVNSNVGVKGIVAELSVDNAEELLTGADVVVDATDNMEARFVMNDACVKLRTPWVYGGAVATSGMVLAVTPDGPCLRCIFPKLPPRGSLPTCDDVGIVNSLPSIIASLEVTETFKILMGLEPARDLLVIDVWTNDFQRISVKKNPDCITCGRHDYYNYEG